MSVKDTIAGEWKAIPRLRDLDTKLAVKDPDICEAAITVMGEHEGDVIPILLIDGISLTLAQHIVSLHNNSIAANAKPKE